MLIGKLEDARAKLAEGLAQAKAGKLFDGEEAVARLRKRIGARRGKRA